MPVYATRETPSASLTSPRPWQFSRQFSQPSVVLNTFAETAYLHLWQIVTVEPQQRDSGIRKRVMP